MKIPFIKKIKEQIATTVWQTATVRRQEMLNRYRPSDQAAVEYMNRAVGEVHACASQNADVCSAMPLRLMRRVKVAETEDRRVHRGKTLSKSARSHLSDSAGLKVAAFAESGGEVEEVVDHPLLDLLANPNPDFPGTQMSWLAFYFKEITGKSYEMISVGADGKPVMLYPLFPQYTSLVFDDEGAISGFRYSRNSTEIADLEREDVIYYRHNVSRFDPNNGEGPLVGVIAEADLITKNLIFDIVNVDNGNQPGSVWQIKDLMATKEQVKEVERRIKDKHTGLHNMTKPIVTRGELTVTPLQFSEKELQSLPKIELFEKRIRRAFGHTESMADSNASTYASSIVGYDHQYMGTTINSRLIRHAAQLNTTLLPMFDIDPSVYCLVYDNPVKKDEKALREETRLDTAAGLLTVNESRLERGMDTSDDPGADMLRINGQTLEGIDEANAQGGLFGGFGGFGSPAPSIGGTDEGEDEAVAPQKIEETALNGAQIAQLVDLGAKVSLGELTSEAARGIALASFPSIPVDKIDAIFNNLVEGDASEEGKALKRLSKSVMLSVKELELKRWKPCEACSKAADLASDPVLDDVFEAGVQGVEGTMKDILFDMQTEVIDAAGAGRESDLQSMMDQAAAELRESMAEAVTDAVRATIDAAPDDVSGSFDLANTAALDFLSTHTIQVASDIADTTETMIRPAVERGLTEGLSIRDIAAQIESEDIPAYRAEAIARTEMQNATQGGRYETIKEMGVDEVEWVNAPGARQSHRMIRDRGRVKVGEPFVKAGETLGKDTFDRDVFHPPAGVNCRCSIRAIFGDE